jgi:RNA polymerase sigma-70 factor (ECF subfamily)
MANTDTRVKNAVHRYLPLVWRVLRRAGLRPADADDGAQDVFWVLAQRVKDVPEVAERSFLVATAMRVASERRRSKWNRSVTEPLEPERLPHSSSSPDMSLELQRRMELLDEVLGCIDAKEREVFILAAIEEMTKSEIATALNIPEGTVASRLQRARASFEAAVRRLHNLKGRLL